LEFIHHIIYVVDACALPSIMPSLSLTDMMYRTPEKKTTPASVQGVSVDVKTDMDFASLYRYETCWK